MKLRSMALGLVLATTAAPAFAGGCDKIIFSDVGWTDITATTAATTVILEALGYETETKILSVPVTYTGLAQGDDRVVRRIAGKRAEQGREHGDSVGGQSIVPRAPVRRRLTIP